jgi:internalin A
MNLPKLIVVAFSAMVALASCRDIHLELATEKQLQSSGHTFADWCRQKSALSPETQHTIEVLLKEAETTDCNVANQKLSILTALNLYNKKISYLKPLKSMTKLEYLELDQNQISDIKPLQSLTNLKRMDLRYNQIKDIKPLQSLTKLNEILIGGNGIYPEKCPLEHCNWQTETFLGN